MEEKLVAILNEMAEYLSIAQMKKLQEVLGDYFESEPMLCGHPLGALPLKTAEIHFLQAK